MMGMVEDLDGLYLVGTLSEGTIGVITVPGSITESQRDAIADQWAMATKGDHTLMVLSEGMTLQLVERGDHGPA